MEDALITKVQWSIDQQVYPPTHQYDVRTLKPGKVLAARVKLLEALCPAMFRATRFLDVGASKGYFSLRLAAAGAQVMAIDPDKSVLMTWAPICPENVTQVCTGFSNIARWVDGTFDVVWIGNGHHYLHREDPVGWLRRLAGLAVDHVIIEGPVGKGARGFQDWAEGTVPKESDWIAEAEVYGLVLQDRCDSVSYTPGRAMWHLRKTN